MSKPKLTEADFQWAADRLGVDVATIKAVDHVESNGGGFLPSGEPTILFEPHIFSRLTKGRFDKTHPKTSYPRWKPGAYGSVSSQHPKLQAAVDLDREAALQSASWGRFQLLGSNWKTMGYPSVQAFINDMYRSERGQLEGFVRFIESQNLARYLKAKDWAGFARRYNGPGYAKNRYDTKLANAYARFSK